jgi:hypothetical protein
MIKKTSLFTLIFLLSQVTLVTEINAQCKSFTKKKCISNLGDYNSNGQYNGAVMFQGEEATLMQTFYSGQKYKLMICSQSSIAEDLFFEVQDFRGNLIYSSDGTDKNFFEFDVESTQQLKIRIVIPYDGGGSQIKKNGCVSVIVGFQE